jgi:hypothetical protein
MLERSEAVSTLEGFLREEYRMSMEEWEDKCEEK